MVHQLVKGVEEFVSKEIILCEVELSTSVPKRIVISRSREIEPLWVTKFIAFKVKVSLSA
jgi:hypothetical protein